MEGDSEEWAAMVEDETIYRLLYIIIEQIAKLPTIFVSIIPLFSPFLKI
ncbi:MAG: hypothetical protein KAX30_08505 [Candidatus Atribacteria bacterium]|nr:hypothetical protein [Candidatus Atribacteria bacterium]